MPDEVIPETGLEDGETMRVTERSVILESGQTVWLRRYTLDDATGQRQWLGDGRWCAQLGGVTHLYAAPSGMTGRDSRTGGRWQYRAPYSFATWQEALDVARRAEEVVPA